MITELRYTPATVEVRAADTGVPCIVGYGACFNKLSQDLGGFVERLAPGAFTKTLRESDVLATFNHDRGQILGRTSSGSLRLGQDQTGLAYEIDPLDSPFDQRIVAQVARGDVKGSSFGFRMVQDEWSLSETGYPLRSLLEVHLGDIGPVVSPAYLDTTAGMRSAFASLSRLRSIPVDEVAAIAGSGQLRALIEGRRVAPGLTADAAQRQLKARRAAAGPSLGDRQLALMRKQRPPALHQ